MSKRGDHTALVTFLIVGATILIALLVYLGVKLILEEEAPEEIIAEIGEEANIRILVAVKPLQGETKGDIVIFNNGKYDVVGLEVIGSNQQESFTTTIEDILIKPQETKLIKIEFPPDVWLRINKVKVIPTFFVSEVGELTLEEKSDEKSLTSAVVCNNNGICESGETEITCPNDCGAGADGGDGNGEECDNDGICDPGETEINCPSDCTEILCDNDGICEAGEDPVNCPNDCESAGCDDCGDGLFGMAILSVEAEGDAIIVTTTGAKYILNQNEIEMYRRIDPSTNSINPRKVAVLNFDGGVGELLIESANGRLAVVQGGKAEFRFHSDSFFFVEAEEEFDYGHENLISSPDWAKTGESNLDRMWTDGYGGSLHAWISGSPSASKSSDSTEFSMSSGDIIGHMVFPPRFYDFEGLYGEGARPFVHFRFTYGQLQYANNDMNGPRDLERNGFGVFGLYNILYEKACIDGLNPRCYPGTRPEWPEQFFSIELDPAEKPWVPKEGLFGYDFDDPQYIKDFINLAHANGFKVIAYMQSGEFDPNREPMYDINDAICQQQDPPMRCYARIDKQPIEDTLLFMESFQQEYGLDGWYFDNAGIKDDNLKINYDFIKKVREDIGDEGIIFHHNSVDVWDGWPNYRGLRGIMIDAYSDYNYAGETDYTLINGEYEGLSAQVDSPNDPYFRYYTSGYGMSQTYSAHIRITNGQAAMSRKEIYRLFGENLHGAVTNLHDPWRNYFKPFYDIKKAEYLSGNFDPDVDWPIDSETGWFREPENINVENLGGGDMKVSWETEELADSNVTYTQNGAWWEAYGSWPDGPEGSVYDGEKVLEHSIVLNDLDPDTEYEFRIRSLNQEKFINEVIWGYVGSFTTG